MRSNRLSIVAAVGSALLILGCFQHAVAKKRQFPAHFKFGAATAAHQIEGAWNVDGKSMNNWNYFEHNVPNAILNGDTADVACDSYRLYEEDVQLLKRLHATTYRFSVSWTRVLPDGYANRKNDAGVAYYNALIDALIANGIEPIVTVFHWDLPWNLQQLGGFANPLVVDLYVDYARFLFETYGDRVKTWITINEPRVMCTLGYGSNWAPGLNASGLADYVCGHNVLKAHAEAYHLYDKEFRSKQKGRIGIVLDNFWSEPASNSADDKAATERMLEFTLGWFAQPIFTPQGDYPDVMKRLVAEASEKQGFPRSRLPSFTESEIARLRGSADFMGLNFYSSNLIADPHDGYRPGTIHVNNDAQIVESKDPSWPTSAVDWLTDTPFGLRRLLRRIKERYGDPEIMITENGFADEGEKCDVRRGNYLAGHLNAAWESIHLDKVNLTRYYAWSLIDDFEWVTGYSLKFGIYHVDFDSANRTRSKKASTDWYANVAKTKTIAKHDKPFDEADFCKGISTKPKKNGDYDDAHQKMHDEHL